MIPVVRQQMILKHLAGVRVAGIHELAEKLGVSSMTIRRDIQKLEAEGKLVSIAGGVTVAGDPVPASSTSNRDGPQILEKEAIAAAAAALIAPGSTIFLDAGTTTMALARRLVETRPDDAELMVVSNDFFITMYLAEHSQYRLFHIGGMVVRENFSCVGDSSAKILRGISIDTSFIGSPSWSNSWLSTSVSEKSPIKRAAISSARYRVLLADSRKYGKTGAFRAVSMASINTIITDSGLPDEAAAALKKRGITLHIVDVSIKKKKKR